MSKITTQLERRLTFFLPIQDAGSYCLLYGGDPLTIEGHHGVDRTWRHKELIKMSPYKNTGYFCHSIGIIDNIISQLFGFKNNIALDTCLIETCGGGPEWTFTIDLDACPYSRISVENACQELTNMILAKADFYADHPKAIYQDFDVPQIVKRHLRRKKGKVRV